MITLTFLILAAVANGFMDMTFNNYAASVFNDQRFNPLFWSPAVSWRNKWKYGDPAYGERFFGSSTFLVWLTDAWHIFKALFILFFLGTCISAGVYGPVISPLWDMLLFAVVWGLMFELTYRSLKK